MSGRYMADRNHLMVCLSPVLDRSGDGIRCDPQLAAGRLLRHPRQLRPLSSMAGN
jgi:hypothetical protein